VPKPNLLCRHRIHTIILLDEVSKKFETSIRQTSQWKGGTIEIVSRRQSAKVQSPRKPTLSPTKFTTYLACRVKFRWTYVDSRGKWYLRAKSYYSFGTTLHNVLQRFHDANDQGVTTTDEVMAAYEENWIDAGFSSAEEMAEAYGEGKLMLTRHVEETHRRKLSSKTLFVERQLRADLGPFVLIGRIDRVDEHEDGTLEIIDYKSGRHDVSPEDVAEDIAMGCYQLLLREKYPDRPVKATIIALRTGAEASFVLGETELEQFRSDILLLGQQILSDEFHGFLPEFKPICKRCDFVPLCRKYEEFTFDGVYEEE
jgi:putative RecB family exonuclease